MVLFREFFAGSIQIIQGGKLLNPGTNNGRVRDVWQGRKGLDWMLLALISDEWPPNLHPVFLAQSSQSAFLLLPGAISPPAASESPEVTGSHNLWDSPARRVAVVL